MAKNTTKTPKQKRPGAPDGNKNREKYTLHEVLKDVPDGTISINTRQVKTNNFNKEKDLTDYIILNINKFCRDILDDELLSFQAEYPLTTQTDKGRCKMVDLYIICEKGRYLIEVKNPSCPCENRYAIGQLLDYGREYLDSKKELPEMILITTGYDLSTAKTIRCYGLPIRYIYFDKKRTLELDNEKESW